MPTPAADLSLHTLAARLDVLEAENRELRAALATRDAREPAPAVPAALAPIEQLSRRWLLRRGMQAAAASVAAGVLLHRDTDDAQAETFDSVFADYVHVDRRNGYNAINASSNSELGTIVTENAGSGPAVKGTSAGTGPAILGEAFGALGIGVSGSGPNHGVYGYSASGDGVRGDGVTGALGVSSTNGYGGVWGQHNGTLGYGVVGDGRGDGAGVLGRNSAGSGVRGEGSIGVWGTTAKPGYQGVYGVHTGTGYGVVGDGGGAATSGVLGRNANGHGVRGEGSIGVWGTSSKPGYQGVYGVHTGTGYGVVGDATGTDTAGVLGRNSTGHGVRGEGLIGVQGTSPTTDQAGVRGIHTGTGYGVVGDGNGAAQAGVLGRNAAGHGVRGEGATGVQGTSTTGSGVRGDGIVGVWGSSLATDQAGVRGIHTGTGYGVVGDGAGGTQAGVLGRNSSGQGVRGEGKTGVLGKSGGSGGNAVLGQASGAATGVNGTSVTGYGGSFKGGAAQLRLVPATSAGAPADGTHAKGELYLDSAAALFICTAGGAPGTWKRVTVS